MAVPAKVYELVPAPGRAQLREVRAVKLTAPSLSAPELLRRVDETYRQHVISLAAQLAPRFLAAEFDGTKPEAEWTKNKGHPYGDYPFNVLEDICQELPICRNETSAKLVLMVSRYAPNATRYYVEACLIHPDEGKTWRTLSGWCLARDVHDIALAQGWAKSKRERSDTPWRR